MQRRHTSDEFTALYERYGQDLVTFCRGRLPGPDDAEDAAHEALLRAYRTLPGVRADESLWPWLATIAAHVCTDMRRQARRRSATDVVPAADTEADPVAPDVHDTVARRLRADLLRRALRGLPPRMRRLVVLRDYMDWSYDEIARTEGTSVASVRSRLMRSRRRLGHRVEEVARAERQWPLPVGWLRRRVDVVRAWTEQLVVGFDAGALLAGLGVGAQAAVILIAAVALGGPSSGRWHRPGVPAAAAIATIGRVAGDPVTPRAGRKVVPAVPSSAPASVTARKLRLEPPRPKLGGRTAPTEESTVTVEDHEAYLYIRVKGPLGPVTPTAAEEDRPQEIWVPCLGVLRSPCAVARPLVGATPE